jgi:hypothetical protein
VKKGAGCVWCARRRIDPDEAVATTLEHEHPGVIGGLQYYAAVRKPAHIRLGEMMLRPAG